MPSAGTTVNGVPSQLTFLVPKDDSSRGERLLAGWGALFRALHPLVSTTRYASVYRALLRWPTQRRSVKLGFSVSPGSGATSLVFGIARTADRRLTPEPSGWLILLRSGAVP